MRIVRRGSNICAIIFDRLPFRLRPVFFRLYQVRDLQVPEISTISKSIGAFALEIDQHR